MANQIIHEVNADNINEESYYNSIQLALMTGYANPYLAIKETGEKVMVKKDHCGNIVGKA